MLATKVASSSLLPAIIELKKPKDAGPRLIIDFAQICLSDLKTSLLNIQEDLKFNSQFTSKIRVFLRFIPNLEA